MHHGAVLTVQAQAFRQLGVPLLEPVKEPYSKYEGPYIRSPAQESYEERTKHFREQLAALKEDTVKAMNQAPGFRV